MQTTNTANCKEQEKLVVILMDEMHIREDLLYDKHTGESLRYFSCILDLFVCIAGAIIGFTNLGHVNSHLRAFENANKTDNDYSLPLANKTDDDYSLPLANKTDDDYSLPLANSILVLLVRGLFTKLYFPYAQFPCTALSGDQMYEPL